MHIRLIGLRPRSRAGAVALGVGIAAIVAVVIALAFTLFLVLAAVGAVAGVGTLLYRRLFGRGALRASAPHEPAFRLDPRLEVHAADARAVRPLPPAPND
jgi:hypothetical protein